MTPAVQQQLQASLAARCATRAPAPVDPERLRAQDRIIANVRNDLRRCHPSRLESSAQA